MSLPRLLLRFGVSALAFLGLAASGVVLVAGNYQAGLGALEGVTVLVLVVSLRNTWDLLVSVAAEGPSTQDAEGAPDGQDRQPDPSAA
jgi:hypothetical protein